MLLDNITRTVIAPIIRPLLEGFMDLAFDDEKINMKSWLVTLALLVRRKGRKTNNLNPSMHVLACNYTKLWLGAFLMRTGVSQTDALKHVLGVFFNRGGALSSAINLNKSVVSSDKQYSTVDFQNIVNGYNGISLSTIKMNASIQSLDNIPMTGADGIYVYTQHRQVERLAQDGSNVNKTKIPVTVQEHVNRTQNRVHINSIGIPQEDVEKVPKYCQLLSDYSIFRLINSFENGPNEPLNNPFITVPELGAEVTIHHITDIQRNLLDKVEVLTEKASGRGWKALRCCLFTSTQTAGVLAEMVSLFQYLTIICLLQQYMHDYDL